MSFISNNDITNQVCVRIDNQTSKCFDIEEIARSPTNIIMLEQVNTTLYNPIEIDMLLVVPDATSDNIDSYTSTVERGFVNISITNLNKGITYDQQKLSFRDGVIKTTMTDKLGVGDYLLTIDYAGNRYYEPTLFSLQFSINKRRVECQFHNNVTGGYPEEIVEVPITLFDSLNNKTINNCIVNYSFNDVNYTTYTNNRGYANLTFPMPNVSGDYCATNIITDDESIIEEYVDDGDVRLYWSADGTLIPYSGDVHDDITMNDINPLDAIVQTVIDIDDENILIINFDQENEISDIFVISHVDTIDNVEYVEEDDIDIVDIEEEEIAEEENTKYNVYIYDLIINIDNNVYEMEEQIVYLAIKKFDTQVIAYYTKDDDTQTIFIDGDVINYNNYMTSNVEYGIVEVYMSDINYSRKTYIDEYGHFSFTISYSEIIKPTPNDIEPFTQFCSPDHPTQITIQDPTTEFYRNYETHNSADFLAIVTDQFTNQRIDESMVTFVITQGEKEVYRYVTEVNENGEAYISFDLSLVGTFKIQAFYHSMFNLLASESQIVEYVVKDSEEE